VEDGWQGGGRSTAGCFFSWREKREMRNAYEYDGMSLVVGREMKYVVKVVTVLLPK
jgi:hypothetical protein